MKPPLILLHGYPFDHTLWDGVTDAIGNQARVIAPDFPGFGGRPVLSDEPSIDLMADEVARVCDSHGVSPVVVAGMSMGGYVALAFAERHADRLAGLALVSTQAAADTDEARQGRRQMIEKVRKEGAKAAAAAALEKVFADQHKQDPSLQRHVFKGAERAGVDGITWALEAMARRPDRIRLLSRISVPAIVLHGAEDKFIPAERARHMARQIPKSEYIEIPGAGHGLPLEAPKEVARSLLELLHDAERHLAPQPGEHAHSEPTRPAITWSPTESGL